MVWLALTMTGCAHRYRIQAKPGYNFVIDNGRTEPNGRISCHVVAIKHDVKTNTDHWVCR